jgi:hypothetical protein
MTFAPRYRLVRYGNSPAWFQRSAAERAAAIPAGRLQMIDGYDYNAPPEVIAPILLDFLR